MHARLIPASLPWLVALLVQVVARQRLCACGYVTSGHVTSSLESADGICSRGAASHRRGMLHRGHAFVICGHGNIFRVMLSVASRHLISHRVGLLMRFPVEVLRPHYVASWTSCKFAQLTGTHTLIQLTLIPLALTQLTLSSYDLHSDHSLSHHSSQALAQFSRQPTKSRFSSADLNFPLQFHVLGHPVLLFVFQFGPWLSLIQGWFVIHRSTSEHLLPELGTVPRTRTVEQAEHFYAPALGTVLLVLGSLDRLQRGQHQSGDAHGRGAAFSGSSKFEGGGKCKNPVKSKKKRGQNFGNLAAQQRLTLYASGEFLHGARHGNGWLQTAPDQRELTPETEGKPWH